MKAAFAVLLLLPAACGTVQTAAEPRARALGPIAAAPAGAPVSGSFATPEGALWIFGNAAASLSDPDPRDGLRGFRFISGHDGAPARILPIIEGEPADRTRFVPLGGTALKPDLYLWYAIFDGDDAEALPLGRGLARSPGRGLTFQRLLTRGSWKYGEASGPLYGAAVWTEGDWVYLFGTRREPRGFPVAVARVEARYVEDPREVEFFDGRTWTTRAGKTLTLFDAGDLFLSVTFNDRLGRYVAVETDGTAVRLRTAQSLTGPWGPPKPVWMPPSCGPSHGISHAVEHATLAQEEAGLLYATYFHRCTGRTELLEIDVR